MKTISNQQLKVIIDALKSCIYTEEVYGNVDIQGFHNFDIDKIKKAGKVLEEISNKKINLNIY